MNPALTSNYSYEDHELAFRKANYKILQIALVAAGYSADRYLVLSPACQTNLLVLEKRKAEWVQVYLNALFAKINLATFADITVCDKMMSDGAALKSLGSRAFLETSLAGTNNDIRWTAKNYGSIGNLQQIQYVNSGASQVLTITLVGTLIRVNLGTNAASVVTSTAAQLLALAALIPALNSLVSYALVLGNNGTGVLATLAAVNFTGGLDPV